MYSIILPDEPIEDTCEECGTKFLAWENPKSELEVSLCKECYREDHWREFC